MFDGTKLKKLEGLNTRGTFKLVHLKDIPTNANIFPLIFVLTINHTEDSSEPLIARFVLGGNKDQSK